MGDGEPAEVWRETGRKARKRHTCSCCRGAIRAGETYTVHFSVHDGGTNSNKICSPCVNDRKAFSDAHGGWLWVPDYFPRALKDCIVDGDPESEKTWQPMLDAIRERGAVAHG
jgi:hypothetical protein